MNNYTQQAKDFVSEMGIEIIKTFVGTKKYFPEDTQPRDVYEIIIKRGDKHFSFSYGDSIVNTESHAIQAFRKKPSDYDILSVLEKYEPEEDIDSFANSLGIEKPSEAIRIHEAVKKIWRDVSGMFCEKELEALREIQ